MAVGDDSPDLSRERAAELCWFEFALTVDLLSAGRIAAEAFEMFGVRSEVHNAGFHHSAFFYRSLTSRG